MAIFTVQGQIVSTTADGWQSSVQTPTMLVDCFNGLEAIRKVADLAFAVADPTRQKLRLVGNAWCAETEEMVDTIVYRR